MPTLQLLSLKENAGLINVFLGSTEDLTAADVLGDILIIAINTFKKAKKQTDKISI